MNPQPPSLLSNSLLNFLLSHQRHFHLYYTVPRLRCAPHIVLLPHQPLHHYPAPYSWSSHFCFFFPFGHDRCRELFGKLFYGLVISIRQGYAYKRFRFSISIFISYFIFFFIHKLTFVSSDSVAYVSSRPAIKSNTIKSYSSPLFESPRKTQGLENNFRGKIAIWHKSQSFRHNLI